jgi:hypothetical protein
MKEAGARYRTVDCVLPMLSAVVRFETVVVKVEERSRV